MSFVGIVGFYYFLCLYFVMEYLFFCMGIRFMFWVRIWGIWEMGLKFRSIYFRLVGIRFSMGWWDKKSFIWVN